MPFFKDNPYRNKKYTDWVKSLECIECGAPADDPHHIINEKEGGAGTKACDLFSMPMCRCCHDEIHRPTGDKSQQWKWAAKTMQKAIKEGFKF